MNDHLKFTQHDQQNVFLSDNFLRFKFLIFLFYSNSSLKSEKLVFGIRDSCPEKHANVLDFLGAKTTI